MDPQPCRKLSGHASKPDRPATRAIRQSFAGKRSAYGAPESGEVSQQYRVTFASRIRNIKLEEKCRPSQAFYPYFTISGYLNTSEGSLAVELATRLNYRLVWRPLAQDKALRQHRSD